MKHNSSGFLATVSTDMDLSQTTALRLYIRKPASGTVLNRIYAASDITHTGTNALSYTVQTGDFDEVGVYQLQLCDETGGKRVWSEISSFPVTSNVTDPNS